ncbi:hypothetical protein CEXT_290611 [Caerostris extrusa]|uniref:Uncharacterized protein n=1 Tax=Caerostris extrusa TaxID=172846 RepID=A0AAV4MTS1_CAEEX|nr:hypothetical protein CEXT_290611 [Caerostris extrusa]
MDSHDVKTNGVSVGLMKAPMVIRNGVRQDTIKGVIQKEAPKKSEPPPLEVNPWKCPRDVIYSTSRGKSISRQGPFTVPLAVDTEYFSLLGDGEGFTSPTSEEEQMASFPKKIPPSKENEKDKFRGVKLFPAKIPQPPSGVRRWQLRSVPPPEECVGWHGVLTRKVRECMGNTVIGNAGCSESLQFRSRERWMHEVPLDILRLAC